MGDAQETNLQDQRFMQRAIKLAARGAGLTAPNPLVGCVLVKGERIIGEGWHKGPGKPHAEVEAIINAGEDARGSTAYVSLEPCNHTGRTGPCTDALIEAGIAEVIYALPDPNPVAAGGAHQLQAAGITVRSGICEDLARHTNRAWLHALKYQRPYVIAKVGMSLDGRIATQSGESQWITSEESRTSSHRLRDGVDAIIVGAGTVIADDPALTARIDDDIKYPLRVVLDSTGRTSPGAKVYERSGIVGRGGAVLATTKTISTSRCAAFEEMGVDIMPVLADHHGRPDLSELLTVLFERDIITLMVEGGGEVLGAFFDANLIDEIELYIAPKLIGGGKAAFGGMGIKHLADAERFNFAAPEQCGPDILMRGIRRPEAR